MIRSAATTTLFAAAMAVTGLPVNAEFRRVQDASQFQQIVDGKTLSRPLVRLKVSRAGAISGKGAQWAVSGNWNWKDGYFCRDLFWGGTPLAYNCQEVAVKGSRIRFTSDQGAGMSAVFRLVKE